MPTIIDGSGSATFQTPLPLAQGGSGNTTGNVASSQVADAFNATGSAPLFACRAWVNFNGTGTVAIRASGNVSSITDNGTGDYTVNFTNAMPDANYNAVGCAGNSDPSIGDRQLSTYPTSTSACRVISGRTATVSKYDSSQLMVSFFR
jgi:hypothetical protein